MTEISWALKDAHERLRAIVTGMSTEQLNATIGPETNSIAVLVTHALGSARQTVSLVAGDELPRDRDSEFQVALGAKELLAALDAADRLVDELSPKLTAAQVARDFSRVDLTSPTGKLTQSGERWLLRTYGHLREHTAHAELTKQMLLAGG